MKEKFKTKSFWVSVVAAVVLVLQTLGLKINAPYINEVVESVCALMIILGIFTAPAPAKKPNIANNNTLNQEENIDKSQKN